MDDNIIIQKAIQEIDTKSWGATEQFLEIHDIIRIDGVPKIDRIDKDKAGGTITAYFAVNGQKFHLSIFMRTEPTLEIFHIATTPYSSVYLRATSETMSRDQLSGLTILESTRGWNKGDPRGSGKVFYKFSAIDIMLAPEPDAFENKLKKLLDYLESDEAGIKRLVDQGKGYIQVAMSFHNGNTMLGGPHIDKESIKRMAALNLEIDFDLYADGNFFT